jgi:hypothetical protein
VLQGDAVITGIDQENEGVAVEFINALRGFDRINVPDLLQKSDNRIAD